MNPATLASKEDKFALSELERLAEIHHINGGNRVHHYFQ